MVLFVENISFDLLFAFHLTVFFFLTLGVLTFWIGTLF